MAQKKMGGLGRGLESIFIDNAAQETENTNQPLLMKLANIEPDPDQPRKNFDAEALASLAQSIKENGLIQPIVVRAGENGFYKIIAGERRWRACKMAGLTEAPVRIMTITEKQAATLTLIENLQREDLSPLEEANGYKSLIDEYNMTQQELADTVGKSRSAVTNSLRLLELPEECAMLVGDGKLSAGHARTLLGLNDKGKINELAKLITEKEMNVRQVEKLVKQCNTKKEEPEAEPEDDNKIEVDYTAELERQLTLSLGRMVKINDNKGKKGKKANSITIEYEDNEDLDRLIEILTAKH